jgi:hypothetical protein
VEEASLLALYKRFSSSARKEVDLSTFKPDFKNNLGLINFYIIPVIDGNEDITVNETTIKEGFTVYVHNYTGFFRKPLESRVHEGKPPVPVKIWRIVDNLTGDWLEQEYVIVVVTQNYFGAELVRVKPYKPVMNIQIKIRVSKKARSYVLEEPLKSPVLMLRKPYSPIKNDIAEEEAGRIKKYLAMLDNERRRGLICEEAYNRLRKRLESVLYEILYEAASNRKRLEESSKVILQQQIFSE